MHDSRMNDRSPVRCALLLGIALSGCGGEAVLQPPAVPAAMTIVSGNGQEGKTDEWLDRFVIRVTDAEGVGAEGVRVIWAVTSGVGRLAELPYLNVNAAGDPASTAASRTGPDGLSGIFFMPTALGPSTVTASVDGPGGTPPGSPVTFAADATVLVIRFTYDSGWVCFLACFIGPDGSSDVVVPMGTTVEWVNLSESQDLRVTSTSVPPGGQPFDSGTLGDRRRFQFVPGVPGTWEYVDQLGGETGTLTAVR